MSTTNSLSFNQYPLPKILGIIGGTGPESTVEYYRLLIASYRNVKQDGRKDEYHAGIPLLNTAKIHVEQAVKRMMQ